MYFSIYTLLYDAAQDSEFVDIFKNGYMPNTLNLGSQQGYYPGFTSFLVNDLPQQTSRQKAQEDIEKFFRDMAKANLKGDGQVLRFTVSRFSQTGAQQLLKFIKSKLVQKESDLANEFLSFEGVDLDSSFDSMPTHRIEVTEILDRRAATKEQRLKFEFVDQKNKDNRKEIHYPNNDCRIIYLWFLLHPRTMIAKTFMQEQFTEEGEFAMLAKYLLNNPSEFTKKVATYQENSLEAGRQNGFEKFFTGNISKVNKAIMEALAGLHTNERWYLIGKEPEGYSISLTEPYVKLMSNYMTLTIKPKFEQDLKDICLR